MRFTWPAERPPERSGAARPSATHLAHLHPRRCGHLAQLLLHLAQLLPHSHGHSTHAVQHSRRPRPQRPWACPLSQSGQNPRVDAKTCRLFQVSGFNLTYTSKSSVIKPNQAESTSDLTLVFEPSDFPGCRTFHMGVNLVSLVLQYDVVLMCHKMNVEYHTLVTRKNESALH